MEDTVRDLWPRVKDAAMQALNARCEERVKTLAARMDKRAQDEVRRFSAIMDDLESTIRAQLKTLHQPQMLSLFDQEERDAFQVDLGVLERRLRNIPEEKEEECRHLLARYAEPRQTLFPLAVLWFIPASVTRGGLH